MSEDTTRDVVVVDGRHWDGVEGSLLYAPTKQLQCSFVEALELAHPCAAVWWDRDVAHRLDEAPRRILIACVPYEWYDGFCEVSVGDKAAFYRLCRDHRWYQIMDLAGYRTEEWIEALPRLQAAYKRQP